MKEQITEIKDVAILLKNILTVLSGQKEYLTIPEAAAYYSVSRESIRRLINENPDIITIKPARLKKMILKSSIDEWLAGMAEHRENEIGMRNLHIESVVRHGLMRHNNN